MITLITGAPGAGKTAALVSMLEDLGKDRAIYAHGIPDLKIPHVFLDDPSNWPDTVPDGAVVIIDEVQTVWRPAGPTQKAHDSIQKLETHRHRGLDFYIITQGPNLVHSNVRALVGRHVHLRDIGVFGRWWYEWPETADNCRTGWKAAPVKKRYRLPKHVFTKYKSASLHVKPERSIPPVLFVFLAALLVLGYLAWTAYGSISAKTQGTAPAPAQTPTAGPAAASSGPASGFDPYTGTLPAPSMPPGVLDDRTAFIPRIPDKPETAPAYDHLRQVVNMPLVTGAVCFRGRCKCVTQQGTDVGLSSDQCRAWLDSPPFDPYTVKVQAVAPSSVPGTPSAGTPSAPAQTAPAPVQTVTSTMAPLNVGGSINPKADAAPPPVLPAGSPVHPTLPTGSAGTLPPPNLLNPHRHT